MVEKGQISTAKDETKPLPANYYKALRPISLIWKGLPVFILDSVIEGELANLDGGIFVFEV